MVATIGWSGDVGLISNEDVVWRMPTDGCILWSDMMAIPVGRAEHGAALEHRRTSSTSPKVQADISAYVKYVRPVQGVEEVDPSWRTTSWSSRLRISRGLLLRSNPPGSDEDVNEVSEAFQAVISG